MALDVYGEIQGVFRHLGTLRNEAGHGTRFTYDEAYLSSSSARPLSASLPLREEPFSARQTQPYFQGLLPENEQLTRLANALRLTPRSYLKILGEVGQECIGAVLFAKAGSPVGDLESAYRPLTCDELRTASSESGIGLMGLQKASRLSIPGAQSKTGLYIEGLEGLEGLGDLEGLGGLRDLEGLEGLGGLEGLEGLGDLEGLGGSDSLERRRRGGRLQGTHLERVRIYQPLGRAASTHIVKLSRFDRIGLAFNEYLCMKAAEICGLDVPPSSILFLDSETPLFLTRRYDRLMADSENLFHTSSDSLPPTDLAAATDFPSTPSAAAATTSAARPRVPLRLHQEDFCQATGKIPAKKYEEGKQGYAKQAGKLLRSHSANPIEDVEKFVAATVFNFLIGNCDNHFKNHSLLYSSDWSQARLAPLYDLVSVTIYPNFERVMGFYIGDTSKIDAIDREHFLAFGQDVRLSASDVGRIIDSVAEVIENAFGAALESIGVSVLSGELAGYDGPAARGGLAWHDGPAARGGLAWHDDPAARGGLALHDETILSTYEKIVNGVRDRKNALAKGLIGT